MKKLLPIIFICVLFVSSTFAGGFQINEAGARAMAMAGAFTGLANDPSAIFFNPAGITQLKGTHFYAGTTLIAPIASFTGPTPSLNESEMKGQVFTPINFYYTQQITDKLYVGIGVNNPYGLGSKWSSGWVGRYLAVDTDLKTFFFTPVLAYKFSDAFSISAGAIFAYGDVMIQRKSPQPIPGQEFDIKLEGNGTAFGFTAGLLIKPSDKFSFGLSYRSEVSFDLKGTATSTPTGFTHPLLHVFLPFPNGDISAPLTTPQNITAGIAVKASDNLIVTADFQYVGWSSYDKLEVTFSNYNAANPLAPGTTVQSADRKYKNTFIARAGFEYSVTEAFQLRGGVLYDKNPVETEYVDPTLPDADRIGLNIGYGAKLSEKLNLDVSYMLLIFADRDVSGSKFGFNGTYKSLAHLFGVNFSYSL